MRSWRRLGGPKLVCLSIAPQAHQPTSQLSLQVRSPRAGGALHIAGRADRTSQGPRCGVILTTSAGALPKLVQRGLPHADGHGAGSSIAPAPALPNNLYEVPQLHNSSVAPAPTSQGPLFIARVRFWWPRSSPRRRVLGHDRQLFERSNASAAFRATPRLRPTHCLVAHEAV